MQTINRGDISSICDDRTYRRGKRYYEEDRVKILSVKDDDVLHIQSRVQGSNHQAYGQSIDISIQAYGEVDIYGICSCPVRFNCKHVIATCLAYLSRPKTSAIENSDVSLNWLNDFVVAKQPLHQQLIASEFIAYILGPSEKTAILTVKFHITRYLKKGGLGKGRFVELHNFTSEYMRPAYAQKSDRDIALLIKAHSDHSWRSGAHPLTGDLGFLALTKIIETGRCYWRDTNQDALQYGSPRSLQMNWMQQENRMHQLLLTVKPTAIVLNTFPPLYFDQSSAVIGPLQDIDFNAQQWTMLQEAPLIPDKASEEFSQQLVIRLPGTHLPPPQKIEKIIIDREQPVAFLHLFAVKMPSDGCFQHQMRLRFIYAGHEITPLPPTLERSIVIDKKIITLLRDLPAETAALKCLYNAGFLSQNLDQQGDILFTSPKISTEIESATHWKIFIDDVLPELEKSGWMIDTDPSFKLQFLQIDKWDAAIEDDADNEWFNLRFDLDIQGRKLPLLPLIAEILKNHDINNLPEMLTVSIGNSQYIQLPSERILPVCQILYELYDASSLKDDGTIQLNNFDVARLADLEENCSNEMIWRGGKALLKLGRNLKNFKGIKNVALPRGLKATLRDYQKTGFNWLCFLRSYNFNGILADDMGLGKTVQALTLLLLEKEKKRMDRPCLIIAPTSLMSNWRRESERFTPALKVLILQGTDRHSRFKEIINNDLILTTYPLLVRDHATLLAHDYHYLILDEAQVIKNPRAKAARLIRDIKTRHRLCLTGTPMENHLGELWALFDFLMPGFLGDQKFFKQCFRNPIEKEGNDDQRQRLTRRVAPFLLRRKKSDVLKELPEKTIIIRSIALDKNQAALYESIRLSMEKKVRDAISQKGLARSHITILDALLKLRQTCCDPQLLSLPQAKKVKESAKLEMLMEMLPELLEEGRRILIFSQFTKMLSIIEKSLINENIAYTKLTGQTKKRDEVIEVFRQGKADVFLISLKAGGVGLNLTEADTVIHYDPWWNPAVENQATDRTHRIGQKKAVFVYKLITENTLEEKIMAMQERKQNLADGVYNQNKQKDMTLNVDDLKALFAPLAG